MKKILSNIIYSTVSKKEISQKHQRIIRDQEWNAIKKHIIPKSKFLDVGCGSGYALNKASKEFQCDSTGIDPEPNKFGVGRYAENLLKNKSSIIKAFSEELPFENKTFDIVYSSHVLEHVNDEEKSLREMKRVLKDNGKLIIGMPTSAMATLNLLSQLIFLTHIKIYEFLRSLSYKKFFNIFLIKSHSYPRARSIWYDIKHYNIKSWQKTIEKEFKTIKVIKPCFYPYPDFPQLFKLHHNSMFTSSVFFICEKY